MPTTYRQIKIYFIKQPLLNELVVLTPAFWLRSNNEPFKNADEQILLVDDSKLPPCDKNLIDAILARLEKSTTASFSDECDRRLMDLLKIYLAPKKFFTIPTVVLLPFLILAFLIAAAGLMACIAFLPASIFLLPIIPLTIVCLGSIATMLQSTHYSSIDIELGVSKRQEAENHLYAELNSTLPRQGVKLPGMAAQAAFFVSTEGQILPVLLAAFEPVRTVQWPLELNNTGKDGGFYFFTRLGKTIPVFDCAVAANAVLEDKHHIISPSPSSASTTASRLANLG